MNKKMLSLITRFCSFRKCILTIVLLGLIYFIIQSVCRLYCSKDMAITPADSAWIGPGIFTDQTVKGIEREKIIYGQELISHTSRYLGPNGTVAKITNGMNCQNCHLQAGNKPWGNNYGAVFSTYPKFRNRSGTTENIYKRVSDCMERSLNGKAIDSNSREFSAIYAYIKWLGKDVKKGTYPSGSGIEKLTYLNRAANPEKGKIVYLAKCQSCHGLHGEGRMAKDGLEYEYPPVWGPNSYNDAAGLFRISNLAGFVRNNMPYLQASHQSPQLQIEECWDVAAFINSQPRPHKDQSADWPDISTKPVDFPFRPFVDSFGELQHKYGPYEPIRNFHK